MKHYKITTEFRGRLNKFLGREYIKKNNVGHKLYHLENYEKIARVSPKKAKLLMATLFPEKVKDPKYLNSHKKEIANLAKRLHVEKKRWPFFSWTNFMVRREMHPPLLEGKKDEDIFKGNIIRFR